MHHRIHVILCIADGRSVCVRGLRFIVISDCTWCLFVRLQDGLLMGRESNDHVGDRPIDAEVYHVWVCFQSIPTPHFSRPGGILLSAFALYKFKQIRYLCTYSVVGYSKHRWTGMYAGQVDMTGQVELLSAYLSARVFLYSIHISKNSYL